MAATPQEIQTTVATHSLPLRVMLRFSPAQYERRFADHYVSVYFRYAQASLVLGLLLVSGDFLVDYLAHPDISANFLRLELCLPVLGAGLAYSFTPDARKRWQPAMCGFIVIMAYILFWILLRIDGEGGAGLKTWVGILNFTFLEFYCFVILGVQFRYALASGLLILVSFEAAMGVHAGLSKAEVVYWSYHVITLFILSAGIGWWREYLLRRDFSARSALEDARLSAERLARMKGDFLATMSHEIRTPMNGVLGMNELLIDSNLLPQQRAWAEGVQSSGRHLLGVINDILDFSKADSGQIELETVDFALVEVVEESVSMFAQPAESKGLELAAQFGPQDDRLVVRGDPFRLRQIVANLVSNAIKFTAKGEVIVRVTVAAQTDTDVTLSVCVQDTGVGIAPEAQARIFERFSQAEGSTTRDYGGTGLGLAISKRLIQLMGGNIRVESAPGEGSKFHAELRLPKASGVPGFIAPSSGLLRGVRVLVVDDNDSNREILRQQLEGWAMDVICAAGGAQALQLIEQATRAGQPIALAVLDLHMPGMDGLQLARAIQALSSVPPIKLIMLISTYGSTEPQTRHDLEFLRCVNKPVRRAVLRQSVSGILAETTPGLPSAPRSSVRIGTMLNGRILLVENNTINQRVAMAMIERLGPSVCLAVDGAAAVEMVRDRAFDMVLMDCQMPVMDGFEATRRIRVWEATHGRGRPAVPIIALTANAMEGDREACIAAGMSDYLTKPITGAALAEMLARHLEQAEPAPASRAAPSVPASSAAPSVPSGAATGPLQPVFDATVLAELPMVADGTEPEFALAVLEQFLQDSVETVESALRAGAVADREGALHGVHTLKSCSAQIGALALSAWAGELENHLRAGHPLDGDSWSRLQVEHRQALLAITTYLAQARNPAEHPIQHGSRAAH
jgi:signal transduction histidine kinase/DNA-binding response OmpR family regulator/HPt (histidine-containing phosphotransfer) domain-containing protein